MTTTRTAPRSKPRVPVIDWRPRRPDAEISGEDKYFIPPEVIPPGMCWEFKRYTIWGEEDVEHQVSMMRDGAWDPVPNEAWPEKLGRFGKTGSPIIVGGQMLMQRPMAYTLEARAEEKAKADSRVTNHFKSLALPDGPLPKAKVQVKMDYSTQLVPSDDEAE